MNSKNRVKEDLRPVLFAHDGGFGRRVKLPVNCVKPPVKRERGWKPVAPRRTEMGE
jgi:hypothetical protein